VDAFRVLGLPYSPDLDDEDVRRAYVHRLRAVQSDSSSETGAAAAVTATVDQLGAIAPGRLSCHPFAGPGN
jgi:hypothetical protein